MYFVIWLLTECAPIAATRTRYSFSRERTSPLHPFGFVSHRSIFKSNFSESFKPGRVNEGSCNALKHDQNDAVGLGFQSSNHTIWTAWEKQNCKFCIFCSRASRSTQIVQIFRKSSFLSVSRTFLNALKLHENRIQSSKQRQGFSTQVFFCGIVKM